MFPSELLVRDHHSVPRLPMRGRVLMTQRRLSCWLLCVVCGLSCTPFCEAPKPLPFAERSHRHWLRSVRHCLVMGRRIVARRMAVPLYITLCHRARNSKYYLFEISAHGLLSSQVVSQSLCNSSHEVAGGSYRWGCSLAGDLRVANPSQHGRF